MRSKAVRLLTVVAASAALLAVPAVVSAPAASADPCGVSHSKSYSGSTFTARITSNPCRIRVRAVATCQYSGTPTFTNNATPGSYVTSGSSTARCGALFVARNGGISV